MTSRRVGRYCRRSWHFGLVCSSIAGPSRAFPGLYQGRANDQESEFTSRALDQWAYANGVALKLIRQGKPTQNAYIESFNGKFRDECLNEYGFTSLAHARALIATLRQDYNEERRMAR